MARGYREALSQGCSGELLPVLGFTPDCGADGLLLGQPWEALHGACTPPSRQSGFTHLALCKHSSMLVEMSFSHITFPYTLYMLASDLHCLLEKYPGKEFFFFLLLSTSKCMVHLYFSL